MVHSSVYPLWYVRGEGRYPAFRPIRRILKMKLLWRFVLIAGVPVWAQISPTINEPPVAGVRTGDAAEPAYLRRGQPGRGPRTQFAFRHRICAVRRADVRSRLQ